MYDLIVCVRCHAHPALVYDTVKAAEQHTNARTTLVVCAVDGRPAFASRLRALVGEERVFCSKRIYGWGAGLFSLMLDSIEWARSKWQFNHFMSIDYDTLFIADNVDEALLGLIDCPTIGLIGHHIVNHVHWSHVYRREKPAFQTAFGEVPSSYHEGEGVQGGCLLLTAAGIQGLVARGMFSPPFREAYKHTQIADDHLLPLFIRMCGLTIKTSAPLTRCEWRASTDPRGLEKKGVLLFHPTKLSPHHGNNAAEYEIRNYFRMLRGVPLLPKP
jgi:hypothetical protein